MFLLLWPFRILESQVDGGGEVASRKFRCGGARKDDIIDQSDATFGNPASLAKNRSLTLVDLSSLRTPTTE